MLKKLLSLIIPEKKELLQHRILIRKNIYFPLPSEKMHFMAIISMLQALDVSKDEVPGKLLYKPIRVNLLLMFSWIDPEQLLFVLRGELRGSRLEIHHTPGIKHLIRSPVDFCDF